MTPQPDTNTLNACLARMIGIKHEIQDDGAVMRLDAGHEFEIFNPINDPVEMELVEAWLKLRDIEFVITSAHLCNLMLVELILANGVFEGKDPDKKRAFALAIWEMMKCDNIQKTELPVS